MNSASNSNIVQNCFGLPDDLVILSPYSQQWPVLFGEEKQRIAEALDTLMPNIIHIGSTAVPGLTAKPIIDIAIGIENSSCRHAATCLLELIGYKGHGEKGIPGRLFFTFGDPRTFHVHLVETHGVIWNRHILFKERLIAFPEIADAYVDLKTRLAMEFPRNRESYTLGKANFIEKTLETARDSVS